MTSQINPSNIDITYPIAGQDNDTQGFRNNYINIRNNINIAASEISDLQSNVIVLQTEVYANANVAAYLPKYTGNISAGNLTVTSLSYINREIIDTTDFITGNATINGSIITQSITTTSGTNADLTIDPDGSGNVFINAANIYMGTTNSTVNTRGNVNAGGYVSAGTNLITNSILTTSGSGANLTITPDNNGGVVINSSNIWLNAGYIRTISPVFHLANANTTTGYIFGGATDVYMGATNGNVTLAGNVVGSAYLFANGVNILSEVNNNIVTINANISTQQTQITSLYTNANANTAAYLTTYNGNISVSNAVLTGNLTTKGARIEAGYQYYAPATNFYYTVNNNVSRFIMDPAGAITNGTVILPSANVDATVISISATQTVTNFQVVPNTGTTLVPSANVTLTGGTGVDYFYHASEAKWYKVR